MLHRATLGVGAAERASEVVAGAKVAGVAIIYEATLVPSKHELIRSWLERELGDSGGDVDELVRYRFDDPAG
jgi:hypothetical protein